MSSCYVELFREDTTCRWGWQCFTCARECTGFRRLGDAEESAQLHEEAVRELSGEAS